MRTPEAAVSDASQLYHAELTRPFESPSKSRRSNAGMPFEQTVRMAIRHPARRHFVKTVWRALLCGPAVWVCVASAQEPLPQFTSSVQLVEVYASVTDAKGE